MMPFSQAQVDAARAAVEARIAAAMAMPEAEANYLRDNPPDFAMPEEPDE